MTKKLIEQGHFADEATVRLIAQKGAWPATQPWESSDFGKPAPGQFVQSTHRYSLFLAGNNSPHYGRSGQHNNRSIARANH